MTMALDNKSERINIVLIYLQDVLKIKYMIPIVTNNITKSMEQTILQSLTAPLWSSPSTKSPPSSCSSPVAGLLKVRKNFGNSVLYDGGPSLSACGYGGGGCDITEID